MNSSAADAGAPDGRRVWVVNHYASAPDRPTGTRHYDLARQLVARGQAVTVFAAGFSNMTQREERLGRRQLWRKQTFDGVEFVWLRTFPYRGNDWRRQLNMLSYMAVFLIVQSRFRRPSVVIGSTVHPFAALAAWVASRARGGRFIFEVRDLWPQTLVDMGALKDGSPGERLLRATEAFLVRRASTIVTLLPGMIDYLRRRGLPTDHVVYLPNGVDLATFDRAARGRSRSDPLEACLAAVESMRSEGRLVLGYIGSFGQVNRASVLIEAAAIAERRAPGRVGLVLVGDGPERRTLEMLGGPGVPAAFPPPLPRRDVPQLLAAVDATVVHATATPVYRYGVSFNKLFEYMAAAKPVVFGCTSAYDPVALAGAGISLPADDPERLAEAFLCLAATVPADRQRLGQAGRRYVEREHNMETLGARLYDLLRPAGAGVEAA